MSRNYDLNPTAAKEANSGGKRIADTGCYVGHFRAAWYEKNNKGTESVNLIFVNDAGQEAGPLSLYTHNGDGKELPSYKMLNAIMACMKQRKLTTQRGRVKLWDSASNSEVEKEKDTYPMLVGPKIGLLLTAEEYLNRDDKVKQRLVIAAPFEHDTQRMADEVLTQATEAVALKKFSDWLTKSDRWLKPLEASRKPTAAQSGSQSYSSDGFDDPSIPF